MRQSPKLRLDALLVARGLAASRERARAMILAGRVSIGGARLDKAGALVPPDAVVGVSEPDHPYVSRGGLKLAYALDQFGIVITGRTALDIGASTGGFTDVLLRRDASRVVALDVGHGQLHWALRTNPRVVAIEGVNARTLHPSALPAGLQRFGIVTIDVSFISLRLILPVVPPLLEPGADVVVLVKPQFEARRGEVRKGIVRDPRVRDRVIEEITAAADQVGLSRVAVAPAPIPGMAGNQEFLLHLRARTV